MRRLSRQSGQPVADQLTHADALILEQPVTSLWNHVVYRASNPRSEPLSAGEGKYEVELGPDGQHRPGVPTEPVSASDAATLSSFAGTLIGRPRVAAFDSSVGKGAS